MEKHKAFSHAQATVRESAKELSVALYLDIGAKIQPYLVSLRTVQLNEYMAEFEKARQTVATHRSVIGGDDHVKE